MADELKFYTWFPTTEEEEEIITQEENAGPPSWYVPPADEEFPINRQNEYNIPSWYYSTDQSAILQDGSFNSNFGYNSGIDRGPNFPYSKDLGATGVYASYGGVDIVATMVIPGQTEPLEIGELQTISYSIHRENVPVRTLGRVGPRGFVKGPRTIAGSLIFTQFDKYFFYKLSNYKKHISAGLYPLSDMLPPFDVTISFANESGSFSKLKIYGITIVDEGSTMSVDDLITEQTFTYMARGIQPLVNYVPNEIREITNLDYVTNRSTILGVSTVSSGTGSKPTPEPGGSELLVEIAKIKSQITEKQNLKSGNEIKLTQLFALLAAREADLAADPSNATLAGLISAIQQDLSNVAGVIGILNEEIAALQLELSKLESNVNE